MRNISDELKQLLQNEVTTITKCVKLTLQSGAIKAFTTLDKNLIFEGVEYVSANLSDVNNLSASLNDDTQTEALSMVLDSINITNAELASGMYDDAKLEIFLLDYENIAVGKLIIKTGYIGEVTKNGDEFTAEIKSLSSKLDIAIGAYYTPTCRAQFGDTKCKVNLSPFTETATVTQIISGSKFLSNELLQPSGYFNHGVLEFTSGANAGLSFEVADFSDQTVQLTLTPKFPFSEGDSFNIIKGCDKNFSTCSGIFNNAANFRGEPHIPGTDTILKTAAN